MTGIERTANREESSNRYGRHNDCYQLHFFSSRTLTFTFGASAT
jgi:hypothetical protein